MFEVDGGGGIGAIGVVVFLFITWQAIMAFWAWLWRSHHKAVLRHRATERERKAKPYLAKHRRTAKAARLR